MTAADDVPADGRVRFAIIGDVEPKPDPVFENLRATVDAINRLHADEPFDFVGGIGDIARNGTHEQYRGASDVLQDLEVVFHPILGNEELGAPTERFFEYVREWNDDPDAIPDIQYTKRYDGYRFVFATPRHRGRAFTFEQLDWFEDRLAESTEPAIAFVHTAPRGVLDAGREMPDRRFDRLLVSPTLQAVFHGHSHMNPDDVSIYGADRWGTHHIHVPGIERTKVGTDHVPRFPVVELDGAGGLAVSIYNLATGAFDDHHARTFEIDRPAARTLRTGPATD